MIVALEGIDASGKGTISQILVERLGFEHVHFPAYDTAVGQEIAALLKEGPQPHHRDWALTLQALMITNRMEIMPGLRSDGNYVLDRYNTSGIIYGEVDGLPRVWLERIHAYLPAPDLNILLDIPVTTSYARRPERRDFYEQQPDRLARVRTAYLDYYAAKAAQDPGRWYVIDANRPLEDVARVVLGHLALGGFQLGLPFRGGW